MSDYIWNELPVEQQRALVAQQMSHEEDLLEYQREKYVNSLGFNPDEKGPEAEFLAHVRKQLAPTYQHWIDITVKPKEKGRLRLPKWLPGLCEIGPAHMADITIRVILTQLFTSKHTLDRYEPGEYYALPTAQFIATQIGEMCIDIMRYRRARKENQYNWKGQNKFFRQWTPERCRAFSRSVDVLADLTWREKQDFGHHMLRIAQSSGVIQLIKHRTKRRSRFVERIFVTLNDDILRSLRESHESLINMLMPTYRPMLCRPTPHTNIEAGGAASPWIRKATIRRRAFGVEAAPLPDLEVRALNALQDCEWAINAPVLAVMEEMFRSDHGQAGLPKYTQPEWFSMDEPYPEGEDKRLKRTWLKKRDALKAAFSVDKQRRFALQARLKEARRLCGRVFWHAWFCDFRSRKYTATEMLSPQGGDWDRGLIKFAKPRKQTEAGLYWLKVHVANLWDQDKIDFPDRVRWVDEHMPMLRAVATSPIEHRGTWISDKKKKNPSFQRLAAAMDLIRSIDDGITEIPVQLDGSCNGAQHWAAMMRDADLAVKVNLVKRSIPGDLYQEVANKCTEICKSNPNTWRELFLAQWGGKIDRSITKRSTMCDPYGITFYGISTYCRTEGNLDWVPADQMPEAAKELATVIDMALKDTLTEPNKGKEWLKAVATMSAKEGVHLSWVTPSGFRVDHHYYQTIERLSYAALFRKSPWKLSFEDLDPSKISVMDSTLGVSPNLTHSIDAAHMTFVLCSCLDRGILQYSMIHDSYGVPAPDVPLLRSAIVEEFVRLHQMDPLQMFKDHMEKILGRQLPDLPERGSFDLNRALDANHMFG